MSRGLLTGAWATLRTPLWLRGARARRLLGPVEPAGCRATQRHADRALWATRAALRVLARPPASPWRNTCLYRSVAGCLALRSLGVPARLRLGVRSAHGPTTDSPASAPGVEAHAWIDAPGIEADAGSGPVDADDASAYVELRRAAAARPTSDPLEAPRG